MDNFQIFVLVHPDITDRYPTESELETLGVRNRHIHELEQVMRKRGSTVHRRCGLEDLTRWSNSLICTRSQVFVAFSDDHRSAGLPEGTVVIADAGTDDPKDTIAGIYAATRTLVSQ